MSSKDRIARDLYNILEDVDCLENCPLREVCEVVEDESHNSNVCRILDTERIGSAENE